MQIFGIQKSTLHQFRHVKEAFKQLNVCQDALFLDAYQHVKEARFLCCCLLQNGPMAAQAMPPWASL